MKKRKVNFENGFLGISILLLISIPFGYFISSLLFTIWAIFSITWIIKEKHFIFNTSLIPFLLFSIMILLTVFWSTDPETTIDKIFRQVPLLIFGIIGSFLPRIREEKFYLYFAKFTNALAIMAVVFFIIAFLKFYKYQFFGFLFYHNLVSPLELNAIYMSYMVAVALMFRFQTLKRNNLLDHLVVFILSLFLLMLASKMVLFITIIVVLITITYNLKSRKKKIITLGFILTALFFSVLLAGPIKKRFLKELNSSITEILNNDRFQKGRVYTGTEARLLQIRAYKEIINSPKEFLIGVGLSASNKRLNKIHIELNTPVVFRNYNFHNQYLQILAEIGLIGLLLLLIALLKAFKQCLLNPLFLPFIVITSAIFLTESVIWRQRGIIFFGLLYITIFLLQSKDESKKSI